VKVEVRQIDKIADGIWYGTSELVRVEAECRQIDKITDGIWYGASDVARLKCKSRDSASRRVANDSPCEEPRRRWVARVRVVPRRPDPTLIAPIRSTRLLPQIAQCLHCRRRDGAEGTLNRCQGEQQNRDRHDLCHLTGVPSQEVSAHAALITLQMQYESRTLAPFEVTDHRPAQGGTSSPHYRVKRERATNVPFCSEPLESESEADSNISLSHS
jgi:hypothetical protein